MSLEDKQAAVKAQIVKRPRKTSPKPIKDVDELPPKHKALAILTENGLTTAEAGKVLGYKGKSVYDPKTKLNKHNLSNRKLGSMALKAVRETLKMKPVKTNERMKCLECKGKNGIVENCSVCNGLGYVIKELYPAHSDRLNAAKMYYDRTDPIVNVNKNLNVNVSVDAIDLSNFE